MKSDSHPLRATLPVNPRRPGVSMGLSSGVLATKCYTLDPISTFWILNVTEHYNLGVLVLCMEAERLRVARASGSVLATYVN